jgi:2-oxoglutarate ferredoxin oxidoreductase subunit alpha
MSKLITGNQAIVKGALKAGLSFFAGYPITPASEIMHDMSDEDISFIHAEDEIASINMIIGASLAGSKVMTSTSGPGFSLMQEAIGFGHMAEIPMVIVNVQRVGPSTGMPTLAGQGDILQTIHGSHGDYYPIVFYPNSVEECYLYTIEAFNAAEESQTPVILLSDAFLARMYETLDIMNIPLKLKSRERNPFTQNDPSLHITGLLSKDGLPQTVNAEYYKEWLKKTQEKIKNVSKNYNFYEYIENKNSDILLIAYGITSRVIYDLKNKYSIFRPIRLFPIIEKLKDIAKKYKKIVVIEMNAGQYKKEVEHLLEKHIDFIPQLGGQLNLEEIKEKLEDLK